MAPTEELLVRNWNTTCSVNFLFQNDKIIQKTNRVLEFITPKWFKSLKSYLQLEIEQIVGH